MNESRKVGRKTSQIGSSAWAQRFRSLRGFLTFLWLRLRYETVIRDLTPLAMHLEREVFPGLRERRVEWLTLRPGEATGPKIESHRSPGEEQSEGEVLVGEAGYERFEFPGADSLARLMRTIDLRAVRLDTRLEYNQIVGAMMLFLHARPDRTEAAPLHGEYAGWNRRTIAGLMRGETGHHRLCALLRYHPAERVYEVEYSYCELFFTKMVRRFVQTRKVFPDHRALFAAAPRAAILVILLCAMPVAWAQWSLPVGIALWVVISIGAMATVAIGLYTLGSIQYDQEHQEQLIKGYMRQITALSRFPESDPNPVLKINLDGQVVYMNPAVRGLLDEMGLREQDVTQLLPADYRALVCECLRSGGRKSEGEVVTHGRVLRYRFSPFPDEQSVIASGADLTYLKQIECELRRMNEQLEQLVEERTEQLRLTQDVTIMSLAGLAETRDPDTGKHLERTRRYVTALAKCLRGQDGYKDLLTDAAIERLHKSTPLHDIGKVGVPDAVLLKAGRLTEDEYETIKKHTEYGANVLQAAEERLGFDSFLGLARDIARYHHERWDGRGYPSGLRGDEIPWSARLMALADVYDALTTRRTYKEAWSHEAAREWILSERGKQFDPAVVDAFVAIEHEFMAIATEFGE